MRRPISACRRCATHRFGFFPPPWSQVAAARRSTGGGQKEEERAYPQSPATAAPPAYRRCMFRTGNRPMPLLPDAHAVPVDPQSPDCPACWRSRPGARVFVPTTRDGVWLRSCVPVATAEGLDGPEVRVGENLYALRRGPDSKDRASGVAGYNVPFASQPIAALLWMLPPIRPVLYEPGRRTGRRSHPFGPSMRGDALPAQSHRALGPPPPCATETDHGARHSSGS